MKKTKIFFIEDDRNIKILVRDNLEHNNYYVRIAETLKEAKYEISRFIPDLIILDRRLPDGDGIDFCREIRLDAKTKDIPVLFLTAMGMIPDKILGFRVGGDDYLTKPFDIEELIARVEAILRRLNKTKYVGKNIFKAKAIELNINCHECIVDGKKIELWPKEFELLKVFLENKNKVLGKDFLAEHVWNCEYFESSRAIEITIQRLRKKLGKRRDMIETVKGYGFKFKERI